jgi:predicted PurR-regulated permease PerM
MSRGWRVAAWLGLLAVAVFIIWLLSPVLLPFFLGMTIAYVLDPAVRRLTKWTQSRTLSTLAVTVLFFIIVVGGIAVLLPVLERQLVGLVQRLVEASISTYNWAVPYIQEHLEQANLPVSAAPNAGDIAGKVLGWTGGVAAGLLTGGLAVVNILSLLVITPVVAFYILRDWPRIVQRVDTWLPRDHVPLIRRQIELIDKRLAGFVRGQALVCLLMGIFYAVALTIAGLNYALLVGLMVGVLTFIPVVGAAIGAVVALAIAVFQFHNWVNVGIVAGIFLVGQFCESYVLSPKLVGDRIGLHPVWIVFALLAGGTLFGFLGLLIAAPASAAIGVLLHLALERYLASPLYRGSGPKEAR